MKIFRILAMLTISLFLFSGCEDEEITNYAFQEISAPANVTASFDVTQDDTGTVSITPSGEGATTFEVYFGDEENETPAIAAAGETLTHVYEEGEYLVRIVAVGSTGLTSEFNQMLTISFRKPENLQINIDQPVTNPKTITVSATADYATLFDVYFGDVENEEPVQIMPGESVEHTYEPGVYEVTVVARGAGAATTEEDMIVIVPEPSDPLKLPVTFDEGTVNYAAGTFGGTSFEVVTNPDLSGVNSEESNVGAITNAGNNWEGIAFTLGEPVDFSGEAKTISMKFWSDVELPVLLKFEGGVNDERQTEVTAMHGGTGWEVVTFNFATDAIKSYIDGTQGAGEPFVPTGQYATMVIFVDGPGTAAGTFYIDDIMQEAPMAPCAEETSENIDPANGAINWTFMTDDADHEFDQFGDVRTDIVANPKTDGINNSCSVQMIEKAEGCATWSGLGTAIPTAIDFTTTDKKIFKMKVLAQDQLAGVTLRLEKEPYPDVDPAEERVAQITEVGVWQELTFDFSDVDDKTFRSIIIYFERDVECDGDVYYFDDLIQTDGTSGGGAEDSFSLPVDFEASVEYTTGGNSVPFEVVTNPEQSGINATANMVGAVTNSGNQYEALTFLLDQAIDFSGSNKTITMKVYSEVAYPVLFKLETGVNGERANEVEVNHGGTGWEELTFDFNTARKSYIDGNQGAGEPFVPTGQYDEFSIFLDFAGTTAGTFYIDDIEQN